VLYLRRTGINEEEVLHMLQLFPRSSALLVLFGMISSDLQRKTAAFLKCIQMERESSISIDILASLYLKQKNYLPAAKLFLKSLEVDLLNVKCYLGLAICLFCLICRAV
jgi:tetratricopeptide (TPR) repeat protein